MVPSLLNILQTQAGTEKESSEHFLRSAGQPALRAVDTTDISPTRKILKIENRSQLSYKNLNRNMVQNLRRRLNRVPAISELDPAARQPSSEISTPCTFLSGYRFNGQCTKARSCRVGNIEYQNNVRPVQCVQGTDNN